MSVEKSVDGKLMATLHWEVEGTHLYYHTGDGDFKPYTEAFAVDKNTVVTVMAFYNGILKENTRPQYEGFIKREFPDDGAMKFERWDIERLTEYFTTHLFNENLFCEEESYKLLLKALILMDAPGWTTDNVDRIIDIQLERCPMNGANNRLVDKTFAALGLLMELVTLILVSIHFF
jgi:hypothetical protein